ncbi:diphthine--ammonia ligase [Halovivax gelatinilyticus]|uniref:diphthine--ammonia ligase n=1 Tax=Halovivax gelatinilyticus TaxID=2961597 RepID=UPI0020CA938C|nr:diphthine--ammonia ligase [Halovivax gelatinilyticus]
MADQSGHWISLFSGGKDSSFALYRALERGMPVSHLVTIHPQSDSYMYHVPATELAELAAEAIGIDLRSVYPDDFEPERAKDSSTQGDMEVEPLEAALRSLDDELDGGIDGLIVGAVESEFQRDRIAGVCERLGCDLFAPLWRESPRTIVDAMFESGFEICIVEVAADGLDESWLGRTLDDEAFEELESLAESHGVHPLGEGGEFETIVVDGPHMDRRIDLAFETDWEGTRGGITIVDASLE